MTERQEAPPAPGEVVYRVDAQARIVFVNGEWDRFALANDGGEVASDRVLGRRLWDFIADVNTREIYRHALDRARAGRPVRFTFRCDSPDCRRLLEVSVGRGPEETVEFRVRTLSEEAGPAQPLLRTASPRSGELVRMCGWCKRVFVGGGWADLEEAAARLDLFKGDRAPAITHGICGPCHKSMSDLLGGD